ncbi:helix-turn-helix transcriptional regulator [Alkaliphilus hydrothermalis]|uniref:DNA-binding XRE family transcriptional regulator n=1 Tax=Alkaliphilus hydrothermalis TaxID=1482730 RepID=A0ABS2NRU9_9FIRM|nr:helix-turn-helix domain-containing protein [Alkaliphilus hydrothermalis]MBM7615658.1 DNA-binding XRE family transcriptional regulator [Alkaliphilus hydrothermalis]
MNREGLINSVWDKFKLVRVELGFTQEEMAEKLGISKKTLVQIEKHRVSPGWTTTVAFCTLFRRSEVLQNAFGGDPLEILEVITNPILLKPKETTLGGKVWWVDILSKENYRIQQNVISQHYRILDKMNRRWLSTFDLDYAKAILMQLASNNNH